MATAAQAQVTQTGECPVGATNCTSSNQNSGDSSVTDNYGDTHSSASQLGNSSSANPSNTTISPEISAKPQVTQNSTNTTTGTISGGNTTSGATGGAAYGNTSTNDNHSAVGNTTASTGASTSSVGSLSTGSSSSGGNTLGGASAVNGPNALTGGNNTATNTAAGGAGGAGGQGGAASGTYSQGQGITDAGNSSNKNANTAAQGQGQQQGIAGSGNSSNKTATSTGTNTSTAQGQASKTATATTQGQGQSTDNKLGQGNQQGTSVDASDRSSHSTNIDGRTWFVPAVVPATPPSQLAVGGIVKETTACGPLLVVEKTPIEGHVAGSFLAWNWLKTFTQGYTYDVRPMLTPDGTPAGYQVIHQPDGEHYIGMQAIVFAAIVGTSSGNSGAVGLGGLSGNNAWGQIGGGASSGVQQLVTNIQTIPCEVPRVRVDQVRLPVVGQVRQ